MVQHGPCNARVWHVIDGSITSNQTKNKVVLLLFLLFESQSAPHFCCSNHNQRHILVPSHILILCHISKVDLCRLFGRFSCTIHSSSQWHSQDYSNAHQHPKPHHAAPTAPPTAYQTTCHGAEQRRRGHGHIAWSGVGRGHLSPALWLAAARSAAASAPLC